jgi:hypothetical protein
MLCEQYKDALIDAAASGVAPCEELRAHLADCWPCREAFMNEQSLFAAINSGLHAAANSEVPPSLFFRVRIALGQETSRKSARVSDALVLATAAGIVLAVFATHTIRRTGDGRERANIAVKTMVRPPKPAPSRETMESPDRLAKPAPSAGSLIGRSFAAPRRGDTVAALPEVLVPRDQSALLASYARQWYGRKHAALMAGAEASVPLEPLQVSPIQIPQLDVKPLAEEGSQ